MAVLLAQAAQEEQAKDGKRRVSALVMSRNEEKEIVMSCFRQVGFCDVAVKDGVLRPGHPGNWVFNMRIIRRVQLASSHRTPSCLHTPRSWSILFT